MKTVLITIGISIVGVIGVGMMFYAFIGFLDWIFRDPFNWIQDTPIIEYVEPIDFQRCRELGGFPVKSGWSGKLKRCDKEIIL